MPGSLFRRNKLQTPADRLVPFQVIGAGMGRTGTSTLHKALEILGVLPVHDWPNLALHASPTGLWTQQIRLKVAAKYSDVWQTSEEWDQILASYAAIVDAPGSEFAIDLAKAYPEAKVILTVRDSPEVWQKSWYDSIYLSHIRLRESRSYQVMDFLDGLLGGARESQIKRALQSGSASSEGAPQIEWYLDHNQIMRKLLPADRLLEYNVKEGWGPLCAFLGKPVPDVPFPHINHRQKYHERIDSRIATANRRLALLLIVIGMMVSAVLAVSWG